MSILNKEKILEQARIFVEEGKYDRAIKEYEKILLADKSDMRVKLRIAELYVKRKQVNDAIRVYREVASVYSSEGFYLKAVTVNKNILRLNPSMIEINEQLAFLYEKMGLIDDAVRQYDIFASAIENKGEINKLLEVRKKIVDLKPDDGDARVKLAEIYQREGRGEEALDQYEEFAKRLEKSGGDENRLIEMYEKILSHRENKGNMLRALVRIYYRRNETKKALKWLEFAKSIVAVDTELIGMQAEIYYKLNQIETARTKFLALSDLYKDGGDVKRAVETLARIAVLIPSEEDRVEKRVADIDPSAVSLFKSVLEQFRMQQMEEGLEGEEETARAEGGPKKPERVEKVAAAKPPVVKDEKPPVSPKAEIKPAARPEAKPSIKTSAKSPPEKEPDWDKTIIIPVNIQKPTTKQVQEPAAPKAPDVSIDELLRKAKSVYNLAHYYKQIGLEKEAAEEIKKADEIYRAISAHFPEAAPKLDEIRGKLGLKKFEARKTAGAGQVEAKKELKEDTPRPKNQNGDKRGDKFEKKEKKRKISFV